jgi:hypothetical protein
MAVVRRLAAGRGLLVGRRRTLARLDGGVVGLLRQAVDLAELAQEAIGDLQRARGEADQAGGDGGDAGVVQPDQQGQPWVDAVDRFVAEEVGGSTPKNAARRSSWCLVGLSRLPERSCPM